MITWIDTGRKPVKTDVSITVSGDGKYVQNGALVRMGHPEKVAIGIEKNDKNIKVYFLPGAGYKVSTLGTTSGVVRIMASKIETYVSPAKIRNDYTLNRTPDGKYWYVESNPGPVWIEK